MFAKRHASDYGTAYRVNDIAIRLIIIGFFAHTRNFHACFQGDEGDEFLMFSERRGSETIGCRFGRKLDRRLRHVDEGTQG